MRNHETALLALAVFFGLAIRMYFFTGLIAGDDVTHVFYSHYMFQARAERPYAMEQRYDVLSDHASVISRRLGVNVPQGLSVLVFGVHEWSLALVPLVFSLAGIVVMYGVLRVLAGPAAGLLGAWMWACLPVDVYHATVWLQDNIFATVFAVFVLGLAASERADKRRYFYALLAGVALGYLEYVKEVAYMCFAPLGVWAIYSSWKNRRMDWRIVYVLLGFLVMQVLASVYFWWDGAGPLAFWRLTLARYLEVFRHHQATHPFPGNLVAAWRYLCNQWVFGYAVVVSPLLVLGALVSKRTPLRGLLGLLLVLQAFIMLEALKRGNWTQRYTLQMTAPFLILTVLGVRALLARLAERWDRRLMPLVSVLLVVATAAALSKEWQQHGRSRAEVLRQAYGYLRECAAENERIYTGHSPNIILSEYDVLAGMMPFKGGLGGLAHAYEARQGWVVISHLDQNPRRGLRQGFRGIAPNWLEVFRAENRGGRYYARVFKILPERPPDLIEVISRPRYPADPPHISDRALEPIRFDAAPETYLSRWRKGVAGVEIVPQDGGLRCELIPGPVGEDNHYGGVHFAVPGMEALRLELELTDSRNVEWLYIYVYGAERGRIIRWRWHLTRSQRERGVSGTFTLVPAEPSGYFRASGHIPAAEIRDVHVFLRMVKGTRAGFVLRRAEVIPAAGTSRPAPK